MPEEVKNKLWHNLLELYASKLLQLDLFAIVALSSFVPIIIHLLLELFDIWILVTEDIKSFRE